MEIFNSFMPLIFIIFIVFIVKIILDNRSNRSEEKDLSVYERKPFLFDSVSELNLYKTLLELFGDKYHIFAQVNYSHLIRPKKSDWKEERKLRNSIDKKSADFVLCDKVRVVPKLIIELDGPYHDLPKEQKRDAFINELTKIVDLPILHLKTSHLDKEFIKNEVNKLID